jgi:hypothetical protein
VLFCSSRQTAITVTSAISLLIGSTLAGMADGDPARYSALAACTALLTGTIAFIAWLARAGSAVNFISESVMLGFKSGVALHLASTQLPKLFGVKGGHGDFWERMHIFLQHLGETNRTSLLLGGAALAVLILGKKLLPNKPVALFVVVGGIVAASFNDFGAHGVKLLGEVPRGLPVPSLPAVHYPDLRELMPLALACFLLGAVETAAIGRMFAEKHGYRLDSNQEFLGLAGANLAAGLGHGFPISGGMSQSLVNESGGARTPLSGLIATGLMLVVALFFTDLLRNLPQPVLAAIVLMAVASLVKVKALKRLWQLHRGEFVVAMAALAGVGRLAARRAPRRDHFARAAHPPRLDPARRVPRSHSGRAPLLRPRASCQQRANPRGARLSDRSAHRLFQRGAYLRCRHGTSRDRIRSAPRHRRPLDFAEPRHGRRADVPPPAIRHREAWHHLSPRRGALCRARHAACRRHRRKDRTHRPLHDARRCDRRLSKPDHGSRWQ